MDLKNKVTDNIYQRISQKEGKKMSDVIDMPLENLHSFKNHPFITQDDELMDNLVNSIKVSGVLVPAIIRPRKEGGYEILSGHRRKRACERAGLKTMPVVIEEYDDDEATVIMVDSNIQREDLLPSERAYAYRLKYLARKHQGIKGGNTLEEIAEVFGDSVKTVQRYINIATLTKNLVNYVDLKKITIKAGHELSYIKPNEQVWVEEIMNGYKVRIAEKKAITLKRLSKDGKLTKELIIKILTEESKAPNYIKIEKDLIDSYFTPNQSDEDKKETIINLLDSWAKNNMAKCG